MRIDALIANILVILVVVRICSSAYSATTNFWMPNDRRWPSTLKSVFFTYLLTRLISEPHLFAVVVLIAQGQHSPTNV